MYRRTLVVVALIVIIVVIIVIAVIVVVAWANDTGTLRLCSRFGSGGYRFCFC